MADNNKHVPLASDPFYKRIARLFRSGPALRRRIRGQDHRGFYDKSVIQSNLGYYGGQAFKREASPFSILGAYGLLDRMSKYAEISEMESVPEINTALDIYSAEITSDDEQGRVLHIYSDNPSIQRALEELFYETVNVDYDLRRWARNLVKFGDFFLYSEVQPDIGVINVEPIPVNEVEREEQYDPDDPYAVRFRLLSRGGKYLENWQVLHFRILGNDLYLPYGSSLLDGVRRTFRQLTMLEDAMLTYRVVRSPERRVFYIDVSGIHPNDVPNYMETVRESIRANVSVDRLTGRLDQRYQPVDVLDDYFIPTRPNSQTKIETLAGGQHVSAVEDVEYIQKKLTAGLKIPRPYLGYTDALGSKGSLSLEDIRFSRTVTSLQKVMIAELNKLAMLHLYAKGFDGTDLLDFEIRLNNPSTVAIQQKLNLWSIKFEIASKAQELSEKAGLVDYEWIQREILGFRMEDIIKMRLGSERDRVRMKTLEALEPPKEQVEGGAMIDPFDPSNYALPGGITPGGVPGQMGKEKGIMPPEKIATQKPGDLLPIKANPEVVDKNRNANKRAKTRMFGARALSSPDFGKSMTTINLTEDKLKEDLNPGGIPRVGLSKDIASSLRKFETHINNEGKMMMKSGVIDIELEDDSIFDNEDPIASLLLLEKKSK